MRKRRFDLKRFNMLRDLHESKMEREKWVFENLTKEQLRSSGVIQ